MSKEDEVAIEATKAPLMEHLVELRRRLIWSLAAIAAAFALCFYFSRDLYNLLLWPYRLAAGVDTPIEMIYTAPQEFFFTEMKLALFGAVFIAFPVIASQIYMFVAPGLYRSERKAFLPFLIATPILFLLGAALVYFVVMPLAMTFFLSMQQTGDSKVHIQLTAQGQRISFADHDADFRLRHLLPVAGAADAAWPRRARHRRPTQGQAPHRHPHRLHRRRRPDAARPDQPDLARHTHRASLRAVHLRRAAGREEARCFDRGEASRQTRLQARLMTLSIDPSPAAHQRLR